MVARTHPAVGLVVIWDRAGEGRVVREAVDGAAALVAALRILAGVGELRDGDRLEVTSDAPPPEDTVTVTPVVSRSSHYS